MQRGRKLGARPGDLNTGGPGDSNMDQFLPLLAGPAGPTLLAQRDAVITELRGLHYSKPALVCPEVNDAQLGMVGEDVKGPEANRRLLDGVRACHDRLVAEGIDLSAYNNVKTAADIVLITSSLGHDQFNLFGSSAGTIIAQQPQAPSRGLQCPGSEGNSVRSVWGRNRAAVYWSM